MKKSTIAISSFLLGALAATTTSSYAADKIEQVKAFISNDISIVFNGEEVKLDTPPLNYNNRLYLPIRDFEKLDMKIEWDDAKRQVGVENNVANSNQTENNADQPTIEKDMQSEISPIYTETLYDWIDISKSIKNPNDIYADVINGQSLVVYNKVKYVSIRNIDYYYDSENNKWYYTNTFLVQFLLQSNINSLNKYVLDKNNNVIPI